MYIPGQRRTESNRAYKKRIYISLRALSIATSTTQEMRVEKRQWPHVDWNAIWKTLTITSKSGADIAYWYKVIHDIIPTNERLHHIKISPTDNCNECNNKDTLIHRLTECGESITNWEWIKKIIARMLRTSPMNVPQEWLLHPHFCLWPPQRQQAVLWLLSRYVTRYQAGGSFFQISSPS